MRYFSKNYYVVKIIADYGDISDTIDVGEFTNYELALMNMKHYYESIRKNIDDAWVIGEIQTINKYRDIDDDNLGFQRRELIKLEAWNMKTGVKLEIKKED